MCACHTIRRLSSPLSHPKLAILYNIKEIDNDNVIDVSSISNYEKYFDRNTVKVKDIYNIILKFNRYYSERKIEMIYIYNKIKDMSTELNTDVNLLLKLFINKFSINDIYMNVKELINEFVYSEEYEEIIIEFNELDHDLKESLSQFIKNMIDRCI